METSEVSARLSAKGWLGFVDDVCQGHLRRTWALSVFVISAWREGKGRLWGHKISFPTYEVLGSGLGEGTQKGTRSAEGLSSFLPWFCGIQISGQMQWNKQM